MKENIFDIFTKKVREEKEKMGTANIMIIGKTGVGKSTLINNVFRDNLAKVGFGKPVTQHICRLTKTSVPLAIYDTKGLELDEKVQNEIKKEILETIKQKLVNENPKEYIHVVWYCINAGSNRIEDFEIQWIREFSEKLPVIIVLTQCAFKKSIEFEKYLKEQNLPVVNTVRTLAEKTEIDEDYSKDAFGLNELVEITYENLDEAAKIAFTNAQKVNIDRKKRLLKTL